MSPRETSENSRPSQTGYTLERLGEQKSDQCVAEAVDTRIVMAFASVDAMDASSAIFLWSLVILQTRRLAAGPGWYGLVLGPVIVLAVCSGHLSLDKHGFGLFMLMQSVWFIVAGCLLIRSVNK